MWKGGFLLIATLAAVSALHSDFGPWVEPTSGEVWPQPNSRVVKDQFWLVRSDVLLITTTGQRCDILLEAAERYYRLLITEAEYAVASDNWEEVRDSELNKGYLRQLHLDVKTPCNGIRPELYMDESYTLNISETSNVVNITANAIWGVLRGLETFTHLLTPSGEAKSLKVKCQTIADRPHLPHRGLLLDTSRHFIPVKDILLTLDAMAYNKLNVFHWHIVDDNSFPFESKRYEDLSKKGSFHPSMTYSPADVAKIVEYARMRGIRVVAEFDTPGHTRSWGMAYPELLTTCYDTKGKPNGKLGPMNPIKPALYDFLRTLYTEIVEVFPDKYVHLGGDEVPFDCWASNPEIVEYMKEKNMTRDYARLESEFIARLLNITGSLNASSIVWQEVFDNGVVLPTTTAVHVWTGRWQKELEMATKAGHPVLLSACWYLDHLATGGDWQKYYNCDPLSFNGARDVRHLMLGGEACMWSEFVDRNNVHSRIWPRASAAAERLWTAHTETAEVAAHRLEEHACRMNRRGIPAQPPNGPGICVLDK